MSYVLSTIHHVCQSLLADLDQELTAGLPPSQELTAAIAVYGILNAIVVMTGTWCELTDGADHVEITDDDLSALLTPLPFEDSDGEA